jgi:hypothetical protein
MDKCIRLYERVNLHYPGRFNTWGDVVPSWNDMYGRDYEGNWYRIDSFQTFEVDPDARPVRNKEIIERLEKQIQEK